MPARLKLNFFSPVAPVRSDIANFTRLVALALQKLADVTVWTAQPEAPELDDQIAVQRFDPADMPWPLVQAADLNIYNLGNNATFHRAIFDVARQAPGLMVLHDTRLQHFFARYSETPGADRDFYLDSMGRAYGPDGTNDARAFLAHDMDLDTLVERYPMTLTALDGALAAVMHNEADQMALARQTRTPVFFLPLPFAGPGASEHLPPGRTLQLIAFGFIGFNRRLSSIMKALARHGDADLRLDIYGAMEDPGAVGGQAAALGLGERVQLHGFVPEAELTAALAHADLAFNLRFPSMGEASASQLRIWDAALPSMVTRTGWYAALPDETVFFVEPEDEIAGIRAHLTALRRDPARFRRAGEYGREVVLRCHTPEAYAQGLLEIACQAPALHARRQAISLSRTAALALMQATDYAGLDLCADAVADAVWALTTPR